MHNRRFPESGVEEYRQELGRAGQEVGWLCGAVGQ